MTSSYTLTDAKTFTITNARYLSSKVAADLKRIQRLYGDPSDVEITIYEEELTMLLKAGYLDSITYGYKRKDTWVSPTLRYEAADFLLFASDDDPGKVKPGADISDAFFSSYLIRSGAWHGLSQGEREGFEQSLPFQRTDASKPGVDGYFAQDREYSSGGRALNRASVRSW